MEAEDKIRDLVKGHFIVKSIDNVNHKPHPFMIGSEHIGFASDNYSGMLGDDCLSDKRCPPCSMKGCNLSYHEHTSDKVIFLSLTRNMSREEAKSVLDSEAFQEVLKEYKIDGVLFRRNERKI
jgi:hypothetical protein